MAGGTLTTPDPVARRTTRKLGQIPKRSFCRLHRRTLGSRTASAKRDIRGTQRPTRRCTTLPRGPCKLLTTWQSKTPPSNGQHLEVQISVGDLLFANVRTAMDNFPEAQQHLEHMHAEQKSSRESLDTAFTELNNCQDFHDSPCRGLEDADEREDYRVEEKSRRRP